MRLQESMKALADPTRRQILDLLRQDSLSAGTIGEHFQRTGAAISHHLSILKQAKLVTDQKAGKFIYYAINRPAVEGIFAWVAALREGESKHENQIGQ